MKFQNDPRASSLREQFQYRGKFPKIEDISSLDIDDRIPPARSTRVPRPQPPLKRAPRLAARGPGGHAAALLPAEEERAQ